MVKEYEKRGMEVYQQQRREGRAVSRICGVDERKGGERRADIVRLDVSKREVASQYSQYSRGEKQMCPHRRCSVFSSPSSLCHRQYSHLLLLPLSLHRLSFDRTFTRRCPLTITISLNLFNITITIASLRLHSLSSVTWWGSEYRL